MVTAQIRGRGIRDPRVLAAMLSVPREQFVPQQFRDEAYEDRPQPIGAGQTISQPYTVAYMAEAAELSSNDKILEVGTGSGYGAAVLSRVGGQVHTIERLPALGQQAQATLQRLGYANVSVHIGDGTLGLPEEAPYDAIIVTAGALHLPPAYSMQLADGGRVVIPIGESLTSQRLYRFRKAGGTLAAEDLGAFAFVPLVGKDGWQTG